MVESVFIRVDKVSKAFKNKEQTVRVLNDVTFGIKRGEMISILGESGCGKSTLLNIIGGFEKPDEGKVFIDGNQVNQANRKCIMLFQNYGLLPWRSVLNNVELGLEGEKMVDLFPHEISGGMQQRVAIARALAIQPELILMDEPFGALDTFNRYYLQDELLRIQEQEKTTIILVTHDIDEAIYLSDRVIMMKANPGEINKELTITLSKPRDRSHGDFQQYRKTIFEEFHFNRPAPSIEFNI